MRGGSVDSKVTFDKDRYAHLPTIKQLRYQAGMSANKVARAIDVHERTVYNWEGHGREISLHDAYRVAELFGKRVDEINWWPDIPQ